MALRRVVLREVKQCIHLKLDRKSLVTNRKWLFDFLSRASELETTNLAFRFWHIWEARNEARNSSKKPNPVRTCGKILAYVDLIKETLFKTSSTTRCESISPSHWTPPPPGVILVNSDTTVFEALGRIGAFIIAWDHQGTCLVSCRQ
jgi:hypothetical protein